MYEISKFSTVNIREYLAESKDAEIGEDVLLRIFSDFSCPINPDLWRDFLNFPHFSKLVEPFMMK